MFDHSLSSSSSSPSEDASLPGPSSSTNMQRASSTSFQSLADANPPPYSPVDPANVVEATTQSACGSKKQIQTGSSRATHDQKATDSYVVDSDFLDQWQRLESPHIAAGSSGSARSQKVAESHVLDSDFLDQWQRLGVAQTSIPTYDAAPSLPPSRLPRPTTQPSFTPAPPSRISPTSPHSPRFTPWRKRMTIRPWTKRSINIILIGETGVGKTAMLDLLSNVLAGVELEEFRSANLATNEQGGSFTGSQTNKPVLYNIECADGHRVNILDTPGLADTRGIDMDRIHKEEIASAIKEKIEVIDAVIILANGTLARLGVATDYALTVISGMFPNSIVGNIGFVFTMVTDPTNFNFERSSLPKELQRAPLWSLNNPFAQWMKFQEKLHATSPTDDDILEDMLESVKRSYAKTLKVLGEKIFKWVDECKVQPTSAIYSLYIMSTEIEAAIANVIARMDQTEQRQSKLLALQANKKAQVQAKKINAKYEEIISRPFYEHEGTGEQHNTLCVHSGCYSNCHIDCSVGFTLDRDNLGTNCNAFSNSSGTGKERVCDECGHLAEDHQHYRSMWAKKMKDDRQIDAEAKLRYDSASTEQERIEVLMKEVKKELKTLEGDIVDLEKDLSELCDKYNNLALSGTFTGYISSAIRLLELRRETMKKEGATTEALQRMEERIKQLEGKRKVVEDAERWKMAIQKEQLQQQLQQQQQQMQAQHHQQPLARLVNGIQSFVVDLWR